MRTTPTEIGLVKADYFTVLFRLKEFFEYRVADEDQAFTVAIEQVIPSKLILVRIDIEGVHILERVRVNSRFERALLSVVQDALLPEDDDIRLDLFNDAVLAVPIRADVPAVIVGKVHAHIPKDGQLLISLDPRKVIAFDALEEQGLRDKAPHPC